MPAVDETLIEDSLDLFDEPADFRPPPPPPTIRSFDRIADLVTSGPDQLQLSLVGKHSLWAHRLWNAGMSMANYLDSHKSMVQGKRVIELGAAAALPSLICAINGASWVAMTDYPDPELIQNIQKNVHLNLSKDTAARTTVQGFQWGQDVSHLITNGSFDLILMADLIFNHTEHGSLLSSSKKLLSRGGCIFTTFSHHVVKWADRDMKFFDKAVEMGFQVEELGEEVWDCMFPDDQGDEKVRSTVHLYKLTLI